MTTLFHGSYAIVSQPQQALGQLRYKPVNHQLCIINQSVIDRCLRFVEAVTLTPEAL